MDVEVECMISIEKLKECYMKRILPLILSRFSFPFVYITPLKKPVFGISKSLMESNNVEMNEFEWDSIVVVRYRSIGDYLDIAQSIIDDGINVYTELLVNKTVVYMTLVESPLSTMMLFTAFSTVILTVYSIAFVMVTKLFY